MNIKQIMMLSFFLLFMYLPMSGQPIQYQMDRQTMSRKFKKAALVIGMLLLCSAPALAQSTVQTYQNVGANNFVLGEGRFNDDLNPLDTDTFIASFTNTHLTPLISDLDNDGKNEIVVFADDDVSVLNKSATSLVFESSFDYGTASQDISNAIIFDIDGDGIDEIIFATENDEVLHILEHNKSSLNNISHTLTAIANHGVGANAGEFMLACRATEDCILVWNEFTVGSTAVQPYLTAQLFNSSGMKAGTSVTLETTGSTTSQNFCFPKMRNIPAIDADLSGDVEYFVTYAHILGQGSPADDVITRVLDVTADTITTDFTISIDAVDDVSAAFAIAGAMNCDNQHERSYSPAVVFDHDVSRFGREILMASQLDTENYRIYAFDSSGNNFDKYPQVERGEGTIISNVFQASTFIDTASNDACVMGYDSIDSQLNMICGNPTTTELPQSAEYTISINDLQAQFNVSQTYRVYNAITHSAEHKDTTSSDGFNPSEIITPYGVLFLSNLNNAFCRGIFSTGNCALGEYFPNGALDSVLLSVDYDQIGSDDLIALTSSQLVYIDDELNDVPANIDAVNYNPCLIQDTVKINATAKIDVTIQENNPSPLLQDVVTSELTLYKDSFNEHTSIIANTTVDATTNQQIHQHVFNMNQTGNGILEIRVFDNGTNSVDDTIERTFTVGINGVEFGDTICSESFAPVDVSDEEAEDAAIIEATGGANLNANAFKSLIDVGNETTGLGDTAFYLTFMLIVMMIVYFVGARAGEPGVAFGAALFLGAFMTILGTLFQVLSVGILIAIIVIAVVLLATILKSLIATTGTGRV